MDEPVVQLSVVQSDPIHLHNGHPSATPDPYPAGSSVSNSEMRITANCGCQTMEESVGISSVAKPELTQVRNSGTAAAHNPNPNPNHGSVANPETLIIACNDGLQASDESVVQLCPVMAEPIQTKNGRITAIPVPNPELIHGFVANLEPLNMACNDGLRALDESVFKSSAVNSEPIQVENGETNSIIIPNPDPNPDHGSVTQKGPYSVPKETLGRLHRHRVKENRSSSTDIDRGQAWERKRQVFMMEYDDCEASFADSRPWDRQGDPIVRTRSLTDEHVEELSGFIDLGFRFSLDEKALDLSDTLPALELYYAVNRHLKDVQIRSSPVSTLQRTSSSDSFCESPLGDSWRISSPGDHPNQVKMRLRHWAKVVACSVKQLL